MHIEMNRSFQAQYRAQGDHNPIIYLGDKIMKTLNTNAVNFAETNMDTIIPVQAYFNAFLEDISSEELIVAEYTASLTQAGKELFSKMFAVSEETIEAVSTAIKNRSIKLRKQISAVAKRHSKAKKTERANAPIFKVNLVDKIQLESSLLLRRVGITPTDSPILELMSIPVMEAGFLFNTEELCSSLKAVLNMSTEVLAA